MTVFVNETTIRLTVFLGVLMVMVLWEMRAPRRANHAPRTIRWFSNIGISLLNSLVVRSIATLGISTAAVTAYGDWGIFNWVPAPTWIAITASVILLDLVIYFQHRLFHALPFMWRLHRMHHADVDFDATTGVRFHPLETIVSLAIKLLAIICLGAPLIAVVLFELILNATALFNHSNVNIPTSIDRVLRWFVVTPDMHRVHHSVRVIELNRNFGFNLPLWDRLFGTYLEQPAEGHKKMQIGLPTFRSHQDMRLDRMLIQPFTNPPP